MALASVNWNNEQPVIFTLNGEVQHVPSSVSGDLSLNRYIREYARLKGTKFMCREGGCGICVVSLEFTHPATGQERVVSVNSCMFPVLACHGLRVTTVEGIGSRKTGYSEIQTRLAHFYGTQCGYCTPGWVMSMYSFLKSNPKATMEEIENSMSGNLCRCTGYRPILDAFKSFASDKCKKLEQKVADIEDLLRVCPKSGLSCHGKCNKNTLNRAPYDCVERNSDFESDAEFLEVALASPSLKLELRGGTQWYKVASVDEIFEIFEMISGNYRLVGGNTSVGILKDQPHPDVFIDINRVSFLKAHSFYSNHLYVGANTTLNDAIELFKAVSEENPRDFAYTKQLARHIEKVANVPVRNVGTLAGNLSIKHAAKEFQSDIFLILETVGAQLSIRGDNEAISMISLPEYLETNMYKKVILQIVLPPIDSNQYIFRTFKITPRAQNALAYVNGGFLLKVNKQEQYSVLEVPRIVFGGINPSFIHAGQTERYLVGQKLLQVKTLQTALNILGKEVQPDYRLPDSRPQYRRRLALALLYRVVLSLNPSSVRKQFRSGGEDITRPLSSGRQEFEINDTDPPLYQPFPKLESLIQCSGEAEFIYDIQNVNNDLFAAFVTAKFGPAELDGLDPSEALKTPGVVAFYSAKDIPGINSFTPISVDIPNDEQLFADKVILHAGQQVGLVVAVDQELADSAAELVRIVYKNRKLPVIDVRQVVKDNDTSRINLLKEIDATTKKDDIKKVIKGDIKVADQYHFTMETLTCLSVPTEEGLDVYSSTQFIQGVQEAISMVLNIPNNKINVTLRRVGGSFGLKLSRGNLVGAACSLAAYLLQRPVRMAVKLETMMEAIGKRHTIFSMYETGVNDDGVVQYMNIQIYIDGGSTYNDPVNQFIELNFNSVYDSSTWSLKTYIVRTDCAVNLWMRAPGTLDSITVAEHVMEHIAHVVCSDPQTVKERNFDTQYPIESLISSLKVKSDYEARKADVEEFNKAQVWKKRGISLVTKKYVLTTLTANHYATISVFSRDGTVAISHGGVEMGQGINTKVAQVCAAELDIPLEFVVVKPNNNFISPNNNASGGSITTDCVAFATIQCCNELKKRLEPVRQKGIPAWADLVKAADLAGIDLKTSYMFSPATDKLEYLLFGAAVSEVEIDILTGEHKIIRVDILEDAGKSKNPYIDIGQVEGAFVMGLGLFTSEEIIRDPNTGRVLTNRTLIYKIPGVKDIPVDFRVYFKKNSDNPLGVLGSKAVSEAPLVLSNTVLFAIRQAIASARRDTGLSDVWLEMDTPFTAEKICLATGIDETKYLL